MNFPFSYTTYKQDLDSVKKNSVAAQPSPSKVGNYTMKYSLIIIAVVILCSKWSGGYSTARNKYYVSETVDKGTSIKYIRQSSPFRIFECMTRSPLLRCFKLFALIKLEQFPLHSSSGNLTQDFMEQFMSREDNFPSLLDKQLDKMSENELTKKLVYYLRNFFKNRELKVNFIPGIVFHFTPNMDNNLKMSIKKGIFIFLHFIEFLLKFCYS